MFRPAPLLLILAASARAGVLVLDAAGAGDFTTVEAAVAQAQDGDVLLVRPGEYVAPPGGVVIPSKALTIVADGTGPVNFPGLHLEGIPPGKTFVLRGLRLVNTEPLVSFARLQIDGGGRVLVEDCHIESPGIGSAFVSDFAINVVAADLILESCEIVGSAGFTPFSPLGKAFPGDLALHAVGARVTASECSFIGGDGGDEPFASSTKGAANGGPAIVSGGSLLLFSGCTITGGDGGHDTGTPLPGGAAAGGPAIVADATTELRLRDTVIAGGAGGTDESGVPGPAGPGLVAPETLIVTLPGPARTLHVEAPRSEGAGSQLVAKGAPGELALLLVSTTAAWMDVPKLAGALLVGPPVGVPVPLGVFDAAGQLEAVLVMPHVGLPPGTALQGVLQLVVTSGASAELGDSTVAIELPIGL